VYALAQLPNGDILAGGDFLSTGTGGPGLNYLARWNGAQWQAFGGGVNFIVRAITQLPNGDVVVGGQFSGAGNAAALRLARWDGAGWSGYEGGLDGTVRALAVQPSGTLAIGGDFTNANGASSTYFARHVTTCPASVAGNGAGCPGSGGISQYSAQSLPWIGSTYRARGTGLPAGGIAVVIGGQTDVSLPLGSIVQPTPASCQLLVDPTTFDVAFTSAIGTVETQLALPRLASLIGGVWSQQLVLIEVDQALAFQQFTSTNALKLTIGAF
jgi:hypothetical protein